MKTAICLFAILITPNVHAGLAARIDQAAVEAEDNLQDVNGKKLLYGTPIHSACTKNGRWACARTASVVLNRAGVTLSRLNGGGCDGTLALAVNEVERQLKSRGWAIITESSQVRPGDVVIWSSVFNRDGKCDGRGDCHVGVYSSKGAFHTFPLGGTPGYSSLMLIGFWFTHAYRPPN